MRQDLVGSVEDGDGLLGLAQIRDLLPLLLCRVDARRVVGHTVGTIKRQPLALARLASSCLPAVPDATQHATQLARTAPRTMPPSHQRSSPTRSSCARGACCSSSASRRPWPRTTLTRPPRSACATRRARVATARARPVRILWPSSSTDPSIQVLHVAPDERGVGAHNLTLPPGSAQTVAASVARHLAARATAVPSAHDEL